MPRNSPDFLLDYSAFVWYHGGALPGGTVPPRDPDNRSAVNPHAASALNRAAAAALDDGLLKILLSSPVIAQPAGTAAGAAPRHTAPQNGPPICKTNPPRPPQNTRNSRPLKPIQLTGARLLLEGKPIGAIAAELGVHRYTVTRWIADPRFQAELRRQVDRAALRNAAQRGATVSQSNRQNEPEGQRRLPGLSFPGCIPGASAQNGGRARDGARGGADQPPRPSK
jgi:hypothetical protein